MLIIVRADRSSYAVRRRSQSQTAGHSFRINLLRGWRRSEFRGRRAETVLACPCVGQRWQQTRPTG